MTIVNVWVYAYCKCEALFSNEIEIAKLRKIHLNTTSVTASFFYFGPIIMSSVTPLCSVPRCNEIVLLSAGGRQIVPGRHALQSVDLVEKKWVNIGFLLDLCVRTCGPIYGSWFHILTEWATFCWLNWQTNASGAMWWPKLELIQIMPPGGQIWNQCKWCHLAKTFETDWVVCIL